MRAPEILLVLSFLIISGCTATPSDTTTTVPVTSITGTVYTNDANGFTMTIHENWFLSEYNNTTDMAIFRVIDSPDGNWSENINVVVFDSGMFPSLADLENGRVESATQFIDTLGSEFPDVALEDSYTTMVGDFPSLNIVYNMTFDGKKKAIQTTIFTEGRGFLFTFTARDTSFETYYYDFLGMLHSFKLLEN